MECYLTCEAIAHNNNFWQLHHKPDEMASSLKRHQFLKVEKKLFVFRICWQLKCCKNLNFIPECIPTKRTVCARGFIMSHQMHLLGQISNNSKTQPGLQFIQLLLPQFVDVETTKHHSFLGDPDTKTHIMQTNKKRQQRCMVYTAQNTQIIFRHVDECVALR